MFTVDGSARNIQAKVDHIRSTLRVVVLVASASTILIFVFV
jgi:hypothetical protein